MADAKKLVMTEQYKGAVEKRKGDKFRQQASNIIREAAHEENVRNARKEVLLTKHQKKIDAKKAEIAHYQAKLDKAQQNIDEGIYTMLGIGTLILFGLLAIVDIALFVKNYDRRIAIAILAAAIIFLIISITAQTLRLEAESEVREYTSKLAIARQELHDLKTPSD